MNNFHETSLNQFYRNILSGFPQTKKRQHAIDPIVVKELNWNPFLGVKTLFLKGLVENTHEKTVYEPIMLFKKVNYQGKLPIIANDGKIYRLEQLSLENTDVLLRCSCLDYRYRFAYYNSLEKSQYGSTPKKYESLGERPPVNPKQVSGLCKHLLKMSKVLKEAGLLKS